MKMKTLFVLLLAGLFASTAAYAKPHTNKPNDSVRASRFFIEVFLRYV